METLVLGRKEVEQVLSMPMTIAAVENALKKEFSMPPKIYLDVPARGDFRAMPCFQEPYCSIKWVNVFPENPKQGLPTVMATIILNDARNALPLAVMDGSLITSYRTGAMAAIATKHLARKNSSVLGLVGAGVQSRTQLLAINEVLALKEVRVCDVVPGAAEKFAAEMQSKTKAEIIAVKSAEECVRGAHVLSTVTPARSPIVKSEWVAEGTHINSFGADAVGKEELDPAILKRARVVVDNTEQATHSGEINVPISKGLFKESDIAGQMVEVVRGQKKIRSSDKDVTVFVSTGLAIQDLATAAAVYEAAKAKGLGVKTSFV
ncbi:ornithine cyclodeaminase family protein [Candidatus Micrarchaeota archaeon]|nr:ornithine cyclodeaminase family protein [Candidatus Micrarchaeota archaeon]